MILNDTLDKMDLSDIFRIFYRKVAEYIFFPSAHGMFSRIDYMLGHNKFNKAEIISSNFSDHNGLK